MLIISEYKKEANENKRICKHTNRKQTWQKNDRPKDKQFRTQNKI